MKRDATNSGGSRKLWARWLDLVCNAFCFHKPHNRISHIKPYTQSNRLLLTDINCSLYIISSFVLGRSAA